MEDFDFKLTCTHCGHKISVPLIYAGKRIKCPKCNDILVVPKAGGAAPSVNQGDLKDSKSETRYAGFDHDLFDIPQEDSTVNQLSGRGALSEKDLEELHKPVEKTISEEAEPFGARRLPWIIDIFLYPLSFWGLVNIGIFIVVTSFLAEVGRILPDVLGCLFGPLTMFIKLVAYLFIYWYFAECVRDSAEGGLRARNVRGDVPGLWDMFIQLFNIVGCLLVFFIPFVFYVLIARRIDVFRIHTTGLGVFTGKNPVVYIPVVASMPLLEIHQLLWDKTSQFGRQVNMLYQPDSWVPHITVLHDEIDADCMDCIFSHFIETPFAWDIEINRLAVIYRKQGEYGLYQEYPLKQ